MMDRTILLLLIVTGASWSFLAYQCDTSYRSYLKYDGLSVEKCDLGSNFVSDQKEIRIQVLQKKFSQDLEVVTCTVTKTYEVS